MLKRLLDWNRRRQRWNEEHAAAWAGQNVPGPSGLSPFQEMFEGRLVTALQEQGLGLQNRILGGDTERFVQGEVLNGKWTIWIYIDQAQALGPKEKRIDMEHWDALTPDDLARTFLKAFIRELQFTLAQ